MNALRSSCTPQILQAPRVAAVIIGRNEGERLRHCLASLQGQVLGLVYVDSGSTDGSPALARQMMFDTVDLDMRMPFTAARARNAGFVKLVTEIEAVQFVQFVDGDCELQPDWLRAGVAFLESRPDVAVVSGRLRERDRAASIYNELCDLEWDAPAGEGLYCGGICMMRADAFQAAGGFRESLIAGEEPELCVRLRAAGWKVWRVHDEMALHDAAITHLSQWWRRSMRTGFAYAEGVHLHGGPPARHWVRESRSAWGWGLCLPAFLLLLGIAWPGLLWGFILYPLQVLRLFLQGRGAFEPRLARAFFLVLGKFAEATGQMKFVLQRLRGEPAELIEYK